MNDEWWYIKFFSNVGHSPSDRFKVLKFSETLLACRNCSFIVVEKIAPNEQQLSPWFRELQTPNGQEFQWNQILVLSLWDLSVKHSHPSRNLRDIKMFSQSVVVRINSKSCSAHTIPVDFRHKEIQLTFSKLERCALKCLSSTEYGLYTNKTSPNRVFSEVFNVAQCRRKSIGRCGFSG